METALLISVVVLVLLEALLIVGGLFLSWIFWTMLKSLVEKLVALDEAANLVVEKLQQAGESLASINSKADSLSEACNSILTPLQDLKGYNEGVVGGAKLIGQGLDRMFNLLSAWMKTLLKATGQNGSHFQTTSPSAEARAWEKNLPRNEILSEFQKLMEEGRVNQVE